MKSTCRRVRRQLRRWRGSLFAAEQWRILYRFEHEFSESLLPFHSLVPPRDRFWADPFVAYVGGRHSIFFEEFTYGDRYGRISVLELTPTGEMGPVHVVLDTGAHLSYPFLLEIGGALFMIPESRATHSIDLYRCLDYPTRWQRELTLMRGIEAVDATLWQQDDRWWLFVGTADGPGEPAWRDLRLFYCDDLFAGKWRPHRLNPIVNDVARARPAGSLYRQNGRLFRPSQNCSQRYGGEILLNEVTALSEHVYHEQTHKVIAPWENSPWLGVHTVNHCAGLTVFDGNIDRRHRFPVGAQRTDGSD